MAKTALENFKNTYAYKELLKRHSLEEYGVWKVRGEDDNPDLHGSHYMPELGLFEGKLVDIINYAITLKRFWTWGAGGDISKVEPPIKIDAHSSEKRIEAEKKIKDLEEALAKAKTELRSL